MTIYEKTKHLYEGQFNALNESIYRKIIQELCNYNREWEEVIANTYFDGYEELFNVLHLEILRNELDSEFFYHLLEKYNYHFVHSLLLFISDICNTNYVKTEDYLMGQHLHSPFIYSIKKERSKYLIESSLGFLSFYKAPDYFKSIGENVLADLATSKVLSDCCHDSTYEVCKTLNDSIAYTALCNQAFVGQFYHSFSYFGGYCIDLNYNCVIPFEKYLSLFNAQVIETIPHSQLDKKLNTIHYSSGKLLYSAMNEQIRKRHLK